MIEHRMIEGESTDTDAEYPFHTNFGGSDDRLREVAVYAAGTFAGATVDFCIQCSGVNLVIASFKKAGIELIKLFDGVLLQATLYDTGPSTSDIHAGIVHG